MVICRVKGIFVVLVFVGWKEWIVFIVCGWILRVCYKFMIFFLVGLFFVILVLFIVFC